MMMIIIMMTAVQRGGSICQTRWVSGGFGTCRDVRAPTGCGQGLGATSPPCLPECLGIANMGSPSPD